MSVNEDKHIPIGEIGSGFYSDNTIGCYDVMKEGSPLIQSCAKTILKFKNFDNEPFVIADYGCADGGTSLPLMYNLIEIIKENKEDLQISIYYEDQPTNDFISLFKRVHGYIPSDYCYLKKYKNVFTFGSATSFFNQILPNRNLHLGYSFTAMHWLSETPKLSIQKDLQHNGGIHHTLWEKNSAAQQLFSNQSKLDFNQILQSRCNELVDGGFFVLVNFCIDSNGYHLGHTGNEQSMYSVMNSVWHELMKEGKITEDEFKFTVIGNYYRSEDELKAPFEDESSPVYKKLNLVSYHTKIVKCAYYKMWLDKKITDPNVYAHKFVLTTRTWSNSSFRSALNNNRSDEEKDKIVDEFYNRYEQFVAKDPTGHAMDYVHSYMVIQKAKQ